MLAERLHHPPREHRDAHDRRDRDRPGGGRRGEQRSDGRPRGGGGRATHGTPLSHSHASHGGSHASQAAPGEARAHGGTTAPAHTGRAHGPETSPAGDASKPPRKRRRRRRKPAPATT